ncbi:bifunctional serine/threonine-protein kinase/formylglycine-generating enzyme family protein [Hyalangium versicolor]|uniref:bifunctional serine/threonine-protein kinase/formylglycine-generating enzyme family protein n=1 Tax=Hyalangium versicolor TaxID=2861190 RepID=UPI002104EEF1|nr:bifunctional serine/threonine-protein kinase/formylglycine-generating enzyme family protein [Hyalangium versicolor]
MSESQLGQLPCLNNELLARLVDGQLPWEDLFRAHRHAAECLSCRELLAALAREGMLPALDEEGHRDSSKRLSSLESSCEWFDKGWIPPTEFDEFRLERPLGRGAMGVVYLAHDRTLDRQVAVKFLAAARPRAQLREQFWNEARAIARVQHPNVVTVFRVGELGDSAYIVSEYLAGQSLERLSLPLPWRRALSLGLRLAGGLSAAHRQGVLHRDLKPANVFLTVEGEVKLLDFGLAEFFSAGQCTAFRGRGSPVGTPRYMAPELFRGEPATPRSDIYSLGLIFHELCTGALPPRQRSSLLSLKAGQRDSELEASRTPGNSPLHAQCVPGIDPDFAAIIERCLHPEPGERFASAAALQAALEELQEPGVLAAGNPYRGLAPFEAEHRALFFGRDADIHAVLERLRHQPCLLIAGDSGVGKSSLCRAGILPRVTLGALDEGRDFSIVTLEPGHRPLAALAAVLAPLLGETEKELEAWLAESPEELGQRLRAAYQQGRGLLLVVDQLEELVTLSEPSQAARFASLLGELALPASGVRVLLTVRGDFLTRLGALPGLGKSIERMLYLLRPLTPDGVREAIVGPARNRDVVFESEALLQTLVEASSHGAGGLPLLQFALAELWERHDSARGCITHASLEEMGGVAGALSRHADAVISRLDRSTQQAARRLFGRLITAEGTRSERSEEKLIEGSDEARSALRALVEGRLLHVRTSGGRASYGIAHEALIGCWGTLRHWLDEDAGQRALRQRIEAAGAEWERLGHTPDLLWRGQPLDEARTLDSSALGAREQGFLQASLRAVRLRRWSRWAAALLLVLGMGATYGASLLKTRLEAERFASSRLAAAKSARAQGQALSGLARASRERSLALFNNHEDSRAGGEKVAREVRQRAETSWAQALAEYQQADEAFAEAAGALGDVLERVQGHTGARQLRIELTYERLLLAEHFHRPDEQARLLKQFKQLAAGDPEWLQRLEAPARLEVETRPPGARVELTRYMDDGKGLRREPIAGQAPADSTPIVWERLLPGSYQLRFTREGHPSVELPLLLERGQRKQVQLTLPAQIPDGYVYIPPGCFLSGSDDPEPIRKLLLSAPMEQNCLLLEAYLIGRTEVTLGDWLEYLDTLPPQAPQRHLLEAFQQGLDTGVRLRKLPDGVWCYSLWLGNGRMLTVREGERLRYPKRSHHQEQDWRRLPVTGLSSKDLQGYLAWLDRSGRLPGARLCTELEWVRAARGADDRRFPHGNRLDKDEANIDETYDREIEAMGLDEVDAHQASVSPFGLQGLAGNAFEMTRPLTLELGDIALHGGAWYFGEVGALVANRQAFDANFRNPMVGLRLCASVSD